MSIALMDEAEARAMVREKVKSREWWVLPWVSGIAGDVSTRIEERYYTGKASADCEVMSLGIPGCFAVSFFRKRRMSPKQAAKIMNAPAELLERQDIFIALDRDDDDEGQRASVARAIGFNTWVMGDDGWSPNE